MDDAVTEVNVAAGSRTSIRSLDLRQVELMRLSFFGSWDWRFWQMVLGKTGAAGVVGLDKVVMREDSIGL